MSSQHIVLQPLSGVNTLHARHANQFWRELTHHWPVENEQRCDWPRERVPCFRATLRSLSCLGKATATPVASQRLKPGELSFFSPLSLHLPTDSLPTFCHEKDFICYLMIEATHILPTTHMYPTPYISITQRPCFIPQLLRLLCPNFHLPQLPPM